MLINHVMELGYRKREHVLYLFQLQKLHFEVQKQQIKLRTYGMC